MILSSYFEGPEKATTDIYMNPLLGLSLCQDITIELSSFSFIASPTTRNILSLTHILSIFSFVIK